MKRFLYKLLVGLLLVIGVGLLYLTNRGVISFKKPYIYHLSGELPANHPLVAFQDVNLIPMDSEKVLVDQTIIVRDGIIEAIGPSNETVVPNGALLIDGRGKFLMPGLMDMHVHIEFENDMLLFVANGVTGVRNMWGNTDKKLLLGMPDQLDLREQIEDGTLIGPTIYTTGPVMEGTPAFHPMATTFTTVEAAKESVEWQAAQGYDAIKVYDHISPEVYGAIIETAEMHGLPVVGHVPTAVGIDGALAAGQRSIEHLSGYIDSDTVEFLIPEDQLDAYAIKTREAGVWNCVTLSVYPVSKQTPEGFQRLQEQPGLRYLSPGWNLISPFFYMMAARAHTYQDADYPERITELNRQMVAALHKADARILLGTDSAQTYHLPGFSIHEELAFLVEAGLSPYEALVAGTRDAAEFMDRESEFGTIEVGKWADLVLLENNPLGDVGNFQDRAGVMLRGRWLPEAELQTMLEGLAESHKPDLVERIWPLGLLGLAAMLYFRSRSGSKA